MRSILAALSAMFLVGLVASPTGRAEPVCQVNAAEPAPAPSVSVNELRGIVETTERLRKVHGAEHVLVAFDIDNTLLTATHDFGSDAWFEWQNALLGRRGCDHLRVGDDFGELLEVQYLAYAIGDMMPTERGTADVVRQLVGFHHPVMALTARGPDIRSPTLRELQEAEITFPTAPRCRAPSDEEPSLCTSRGVIGSEAIRAVSHNALSEAERERLGDEPRSISYSDGVMMVAGQDKGIMLRLLLASTDAAIDAVVFVDDGAGNVFNVDRAFGSHGSVDVHTFWYTAFEERDRAFLADPGRLERVTEAWRELSTTLCKTVMTYCGP